MSTEFSPLTLYTDLVGEVDKKWEEFATQNSGWQGRVVVPFKALFNAIVFFGICLLGTIEAVAKLAYHYLVEETFNKNELSNAKDFLLNCFINLLATPLSFPVNWIYGSYIGITEGPKDLPVAAPCFHPNWWKEQFSSSSSSSL